MANADPNKWCFIYYYDADSEPHVMRDVPSVDADALIRDLQERGS